LRGLPPFFAPFSLPFCSTDCFSPLYQKCERRGDFCRRVEIGEFRDSWSVPQRKDKSRGLEFYSSIFSLLAPCPPYYPSFCLRLTDVLQNYSPRGNADFRDYLPPPLPHSTPACLTITLVRNRRNKPRVAIQSFSPLAEQPRPPPLLFPS